jgi:hypothetical protein
LANTLAATSSERWVDPENSNEEADPVGNLGKAGTSGLASGKGKLMLRRGIEAAREGRTGLPGMADGLVRPVKLV